MFQHVRDSYLGISLYWNQTEKQQDEALSSDSVDDVHTS